MSLHAKMLLGIYTHKKSILQPQFLFIFVLFIKIPIYYFGW